MDKRQQSIEEANKLIERLELLRWLKAAEIQELFDVVVDGYESRMEKAALYEKLRS